MEIVSLEITIKKGGSYKGKVGQSGVNELWMELFPEAEVLHLIKEESDHYAILMITERRVAKRNRSFRFLKAWTTDASSICLIKDAWNLYSKGAMHGHRLNKSLKITEKALQV